MKMSNLEILQIRMLKVVTQVVCWAKAANKYQQNEDFSSTFDDLTFAILVGRVHVSNILKLSLLLGPPGSPADTKPRWRRLQFNLNGWTKSD